jgi:hypothetical protein
MGGIGWQEINIIHEEGKALAEIMLCNASNTLLRF